MISQTINEIDNHYNYALTTDPTSRIKFKNNNYCNQHITTLVKCLCQTTFFTGYIFYITIGAAILYGSINQMKTCPISHLWDFLFVCIIFTISLQPFTLIFLKYFNQRCLIIVYFSNYIIIEILFILWGSTEIGLIADPDLFYNNNTNFIIIFPNPQSMNLTACKDLQYTNVWKYSIFSLFLQILFNIIIVILMCGKF